MYIYKPDNIINAEAVTCPTTTTTATVSPAAKIETVAAVIVPSSSSSSRKSRQASGFVMNSWTCRANRAQLSPRRCRESSSRLVAIITDPKSRRFARETNVCTNNGLRACEPDRRANDDARVNVRLVRHEGILQFC